MQLVTMTNKSVENVVLRRHPLQLWWGPAPHLVKLGQVATPAEQVLPKWVASLVRFIRQLHVTHLADIAVDMEVLLHGDHPNSFFGPLHRCDALTTGSTLWGKNPMEVVDTVDLVVEVDRERNTVEAFIADAAAEAAWMEGFSDRLKNAFHDKMPAYSTFLRGLLKS